MIHNAFTLSESNSKKYNSLTPTFMSGAREKEKKLRALALWKTIKTKIPTF